MEYKIKVCQRIFATMFNMAAFLFITVGLSRAADTTPPQLKSLSINPTTVNVSTQAQTVSFTAHITDNLSGFTWGVITITSPSGKQQRAANAVLLSGNSLDGVWTFPITIPKYSETGSWKVTQILLQDKTGNNSNFNEIENIQVIDSVSKLSLLLNGSGGGSINTIPSGLLACSYPTQTGTCVTNQPTNSTVTLIATPSSDSFFGGWGGECAYCASNSCDVMLNNDKSCLATMNILPLVQIAGPTLVASISNAYSQLKEGTSEKILAVAVELTEEVNFNRNIKLTLQGGYDADFNVNNSYTTINGILTISQGSLTIENIKIK